MSATTTIANARQIFGEFSVAMVTPFKADGDLDVATGVRLASHLVDKGVDSLVLAGTTGESPTTSAAEKLELLTAVRSEMPSHVKVIAGVGSYDTRTSVELARQASSAGADGVLLVTPYYSKPSQEGVIMHSLAVADASEVPVCLYDIPGRSAIPLDTDTIIRLAQHPNIAALKDAKGDFAAAAPLMESTGLGWYCGDDSLTIPWLALGCAGTISVIGHLAPVELRQMLTCIEEGDLARAREINATLTPLYEAQARYGGVSLVKAALKLQGLPVGEPRLPLMDLSTAQYDVLAEDLTKAGVL